MPNPKPLSTGGTSFDAGAMLRLVFSGRERDDLESMVKAIRQRREFRLVRGIKP
jgi:hypothetical protein